MLNLTRTGKGAIWQFQLYHLHKMFIVENNRWGSDVLFTLKKKTRLFCVHLTGFPQSQAIPDNSGKFIFFLNSDWFNFFWQNKG